MRYLIMGISGIILASCHLQPAKFKTDKMEPSTLQFVNKTIESLVESGIQDDVKITINTHSIRQLSKNPLGFLELQDYIIRRIETTSPDLGKKFKLGISLNVTRDISDLNNAIKSLGQKKSEINSITDNVDYVTANFDSKNGNMFAKYLGNLGVNLEQTAQDPEILVSSGFNFRQCLQIAKNTGSHWTKLRINLPEQPLSRNLQNHLSKCLRFIKSHKRGIDLVITPSTLQKS